MANKRKPSKPLVTQDVDREIQRMLEELEEETERMSDWERTDFFPSVSDQFTQGGTLSDKQYNCLKKIYDRLIK